ncbi:hypothetical protein CDD82_3208 [Ophiocordyceps australis]|uniref:Uncharacterized protein n=1 Tax=Ophiocordyceps australis TaxID=1399860 RepID=A0A2C5XQU3_9HYPO|nr:hypothetical protein CDD82_3208 [Ophiocordyceps australis]
MTPLLVLFSLLSIANGISTPAPKPPQPTSAPCFLLQLQVLDQADLDAILGPMRDFARRTESVQAELDIPQDAAEKDDGPIEAVPSGPGPHHVYTVQWETLEHSQVCSSSQLVPDWAARPLIPPTSRTCLPVAHKSAANAIRAWAWTRLTLSNQPEDRLLRIPRIWAIDPRGNSVRVYPARNQRLSDGDALLPRRGAWDREQIQWVAALPYLPFRVPFKRALRTMSAEQLDAYVNSLWWMQMPSSEPIPGSSGQAEAKPSTTIQAAAKASTTARAGRRASTTSKVKQRASTASQAKQRASVAPQARQRASIAPQARQRASKTTQAEKQPCTTTQAEEKAPKPTKSTVSRRRSYTLGYKDAVRKVRQFVLSRNLEEVLTYPQVLQIINNLRRYPPKASNSNSYLQGRASGFDDFYQFFKTRSMRSSTDVVSGSDLSFDSTCRLLEPLPRESYSENINRLRKEISEGRERLNYLELVSEAFHGYCPSPEPPTCEPPLKKARLSADDEAESLQMCDKELLAMIRDYAREIASESNDQEVWRGADIIDKQTQILLQPACPEAATNRAVSDQTVPDRAVTGQAVTVSDQAVPDQAVPGACEQGQAFQQEAFRQGALQQEALQQDAFQQGAFHQETFQALPDHPGPSSQGDPFQAGPSHQGHALRSPSVSPQTEWDPTYWRDLVKEVKQQFGIPEQDFLAGLDSGPEWLRQRQSLGRFLNAEFPGFLEVVDFVYEENIQFSSCIEPKGRPISQ